MSTFGRVFRVTTFGESHGAGVGAIVDGVPPRMPLTEAVIQPQLTRRRPGQGRGGTTRSEADRVTILSGVEHGLTLGSPIMLLVRNKDVRPQDYASMSHIPRPGHADYSTLAKYGIKATSGGGRSSARETIGRVAAGAIAEHWLRHKWGVEIVAFVSSVGAVSMTSSTRCTCCPPATAAAAAGGGACDATLASPWSRAEIDTRGTLRIVRNCSYWKPHHANSDDQKAADDAAEARFCSDGGSATEPAYVAWDGTVLTRTGAVIAQTASGGGASGGASSGGGAGAGAGAGAREVAASTAASAGSTTVPKGWAVSGEVVCVRCPCPQAAARMATLYRTVKHDKDSIGGVLTCVCRNVPAGLGEPCFDKLEAALAGAMLSLPATKGFEIGSGFAGTRMRGSQHNDAYTRPKKRQRVSSSAAGARVVPPGPQLEPATNWAGGTYGGITSGADLVFRVAIKPVSTIGRPQATSDYGGATRTLEARGRHDACVLPRAPPLVEGMAALVLADAAMLQLSRTAAASEYTVPDTVTRASSSSPPPPSNKQT